MSDSDDPSSHAARALARLLAEAAARRGAGVAAAVDEPELRRLVAAISADPDGDAVEGFFEAFGKELGARGARLPPLDELPPAAWPFVAALAAALEPGADGELDFEAAATRLDATLGQVLGESPRQLRERLFEEALRARIAAGVAESMRRHGLVPERDKAPDSDEFWDLVELAGRDRRGFLKRLATLPETRLVELYWEHSAAAMELARAGVGANVPDEIDPLAAWIVAQGYAYHTSVVARPESAPVSVSQPVDLGADVARAYFERFGRDVRAAGL